MRKAPLTVCVVGGGFTGAAASIACLARVERPFRLIVVEPSASLGRGVAYGAHHPLHLLNVRTRDLSVRAGQPGDFLNWAFRQLDQGENHAGLHDGPRPYLPAAPTVRRICSRALLRGGGGEGRCRAQNRQCRRHLLRQGGQPLHPSLRPVRAAEADSVLLATAYGLQPIQRHRGACALRRAALRSPCLAKSMALIGSGLTMVDVLLSARRDGFQGKATVISGAGNSRALMRRKASCRTRLDFRAPSALSGLTGSVAIACAAAEAHGTPWQSVINGLRSSLQDIWRSLPVEEQSRFLRHVRPLWDAHRHRLPPEVHGRLRGRVRRRPGGAAAWQRDVGRAGRRWLQADAKRRAGLRASRR